MAVDSLICYLLYLVYHYISYVYPSNTVYPVYPYLFCEPMFTLVILYTLYTLVYHVYPINTVCLVYPVYRPMFTLVILYTL